MPDPIVLLYSPAGAVTPANEVEILHATPLVHPDHGDLGLDEQFLDSLIQDFEANQRAGLVPFDFDHRGASGDDTSAAGWIQGLRRDGKRLLGTVEWTPDGEDAIKKKKYKLVSAEYTTNLRSKTTGELTGAPRLKAATLTNRPFIEGMTPVALSDGGGMIAALADGTIGGTSTSKLPNSSYAWIGPDGTPHLPYKDASGQIDAAHTRNALARLNQVQGLSGATATKVRQKLEAALRSVGGHPGADSNNDSGSKKMSETLTTLRSTLALADDATEDVILAAVKQMRDDAAKPKKTENTVSLADFQAMEKRVELAEQSAKDNAQKLHDAERDKTLDAFIRSGKLTPAELPLYVKLYDAAEAETIEALNARPEHRERFKAVGSGNTDTVGDVDISGNTDESRSNLSTRAATLLSEGKARDIGHALLLAEREATTGKVA